VFQYTKSAPISVAPRILRVHIFRVHPRNRLRPLRILPALLCQAIFQSGKIKKVALVINKATGLQDAFEGRVNVPLPCLGPVADFKIIPSEKESKRG